ncbi:hypothetical protein M3J09_012012 [Ascochyta lentis]
MSVIECWFVDCIPQFNPNSSESPQSPQKESSQYFLAKGVLRFDQSSKSTM